MSEFNREQAEYWANLDTESGDHVVDGLRVPRLATQDWRGHHLRAALEEIDALRAALAEALEEWEAWVSTGECRFTTRHQNPFARIAELRAKFLNR